MIKKKKLHIARETIRVLTTERLRQVAGGDVGTSNWTTSDLCGRASFRTCWFMDTCIGINPP